jgi:hypothetical protein
LRAYDAAKLLRNREPNENDLRATRTTLQLLGNWEYRRKKLILTGEGYVTRLPYFDLTTEGATYVYGFSDKGVHENGGELIKTFDEHSERTLDHELEITYFHIALKPFCEKNDLNLYWQQADLKTATIHPDAYFSIGKGEKWNHFFLEIERSKIGNYREGESSIIRKLGKYYDLFDTNGCEKDWNFKQFRVIVVQRTDERRQNLCNALQSKYKHRMFWITTEALYKADIGGDIFKTPKDYADKTYSFRGL